MRQMALNFVKSREDLAFSSTHCQSFSTKYHRDVAYKNINQMTQNEAWPKVKIHHDIKSVIKN